MKPTKPGSAPEAGVPLKILKSSASAACCGGTIAEAPAVTSFSPEAIKQQVREYYAGRVQEKNASCCGSSGGTELITKLAGYEESTLSALPPAAVEKSFGCGDPLQFAEVKPGQTVLDIGSGAGIDCFIAAHKVGPTGKVIGLDMTPTMIETARRNAQEAGIINVEFLLGDAEQMPVPDNSVDWVISNCVINLAPDKAKVFANIARILKPGGRLSISDIVADALPENIRQHALAYCGCVAGAITTDDYIGALHDAGLLDVRVESRIDYEASQIATMILDEPRLREEFGDLLESSPELVPLVKVASVKVVGRKPDTDEHVTYNVEPMQRHHLPGVERLLRISDLPVDELAKSIPDGLVALHEGRLIGAVALERYGAAGLLRSFVVAPGWRGRGVGKAAARALLARASETGIREVFLLTNTIKELAARFGFRTIRRDEVPTTVSQSVEFRLNSCDGAVVMKMELDGLKIS